VNLGKNIQICIMIVDCENGNWIEPAQGLSSTSTGNRIVVGRKEGRGGKGQLDRTSDNGFASVRKTP
jgi:hypothetical protein